jgi:stringent starvation protein B
MSSPHPLPPKKEVALALLERSNDRGIFVHLDPRQATVVVPPWFKKQPQLVLQIGLNMPVPIPDLRLDEDGLSCTLSFNRSPFHCVVPWASVFAMVGEDGRGMVWPEDVPAEVPLSRQGQQPAAAAPTPMRALDGAKKGTKEKDAKGDGAKKRSRKRPALAAVPDGDAQASKKAKGPRAIRGEPPVQAVSPRPIVSPAPAPKRAPAQRSAPAASKGKKRELPPYLRVVK